MKKRLRWFLVGLGLYLVVLSVDYTLARQDHAPIFAIETLTYKDGGTKVYLGLGYKVIRYHVIDGRQDTDFGSWFIHYNNSK